jgi:hypothetical protein
VLDRDHVEEPGGLDLLPLIGQLAWSRMRRTRGQTLADGVVYLLDLIEERVAAAGKTWMRSARRARSPHPRGAGSSR